MDIFNLGDYIVLSRINKEVAIFLGANQDDNEVVSYILKILYLY